jgi:HD-like signal output (HDOD) protein
MDSTPPALSPKRPLSRTWSSSKTHKPDVVPWTVDGLVAGVHKLLYSTTYKPPMLPRAALAVMELTRRSDVPFTHIVKAVESDPVFAATVLRVANSPVYNTRVPATSIEQALTRMGLRQFSDLCLESAMSGRVFRSPTLAEPMEQVRRHSSAVAHISRIIAQSMGEMGAKAFGRGLLHDVGIAIGILAATTPGLFTSVTYADAWPVIYAAHSTIGRMLLDAWKLDPELRCAVEDHEASKVGTKEVAILVLANEIAEDLGFGVPPLGVGVPKNRHVAAAIETLGLTERDLVEGRELAKSIVNGI